MVGLVLGSNSKESINELVMERVSHKGKFKTIKLSNFRYIPIFSKDITEVPLQIHEILEELSKLSTIVFFCPEHNGHIPAFLKNILDWISVIKVDFLKDKSIVVVSVSRTERTKRRMEDGLKITFESFEPKVFKFFNCNRYSDEDEVEESKVDEIIELIESLS